MLKKNEFKTFIFLCLTMTSLLSLLTSCVGTLEDKNPPSTKSATTSGEPVVFAGIVEATAISDSKISLNFLPGTGVQSNLVYLVYINHSDVPIEVKGGSLSPNASGYLSYVVSHLNVNTTYSFAIGVRDLTSGIESDQNKELYATTFANFTADFDGIGNAYAAAGEAGSSNIIVEWIPAITKGAGSFPKSSDPIAYEIRYMDAQYGKPTDLKNKNNPYVSAAMLPVTISSSSPVSTERTRTVGGLLSGTKYYFMVRCIHKGYALYGDDPNYKLEENLKVMSVTTTKLGELLEWDNASSKVVAPTGEDGLTKADVSWGKAQGPFKFYRVYYIKIGDADALDTNGDGVNDITYDDLKIASPDFDTTYIQTMTDNGDYTDVASQLSNIRLGQTSSLVSYGYYKLQVFVCTNASCADGFRIAGNLLYYRVIPSLAPFSGLLAIKNPKDLTQVSNPGTTDTITVTFDGPVVTAGYANKLELYCYSDINDTSPVLLDYNVANASGKAGCNGLTRITQTPAGSTAIGAFGAIEIQADFIPTGKTASTRQYCFAAIPVIESANYVNRDIANATVRCKTIEIKVPSMDEFTGVDDVCSAATTSLHASWKVPTNGIFNRYEVFWKEVDGNGFKYKDAIVPAVAPATTNINGYSSADNITAATLSYDITGLIPGKSYQYGVLTYLDDGAGGKTYSEYNAGSKSCALALPEPTFGEWVDIFAIGPKEDGRAPLEDSTGKRTFLFETISTLGQAIEVEVDSTTLNPTSNHIDMFGDNSISTSTFDGVWGKPNADITQTVAHRYSNSGIIRLMWKDVTFDAGTKSLNDYLVQYGDDIVAVKKNRLFGYKVLRSEDEGNTWVELTSSATYPFQTTGNSGFIHPKDFTEYPRTNVATPTTIKVGEFIDYSVRYADNNGAIERARVYWYKVIPVFNGKELVFQRSQTNPQHIIKVVLPPPNMGLVNRLMANRQTCMELGKAYSTKIEEFYSCPYDGVGAKSITTPWVVGSTVYDFGGSVLMDRYEMGCNYTRGDQTNTRSYFSNPNYDFAGDGDNGQFRGCLIQKSASGPSNGSSATGSWASEKVYMVGDCLTHNYVNLTDSTCIDPAKVIYRNYITPGLSDGFPVSDCTSATGTTAVMTNPYDSNTGDYKKYLAQSEYLGVLFNTVASNLQYYTLIGRSYHGAGGSFSTPSKAITVSSERVSRCMMNIPVADTTDTNGSGQARLQPRWIGVNNLDALEHDGVTINLLDKTVGQMESLVSGAGAAGNLFDTSANALPSSSYRTSYNQRYDATTPVAKVFSSNKSKLPPLQGISQVQAESICDAYQVEIGHVKDSVFTNSVGSFHKRLIRRTEGIVATAPPKMINDTTAGQIEDGSYQQIPVTAGTPFKAGCNTYSRATTNFNGLSDDAGEPITPLMNDTRTSGTNNYSPFFTGSSNYEPSALGGIYSTQACQGRYGVQDLMGNLSEYSSEHIFCDFSGEKFYFGAGGTGTVATSMLNGGGGVDYYNAGNIFPWVDSDPTTGQCSMAEFGAARAPANAPTQSNVMLPTYDIFGARNTNMILTPEFNDKTFMMDYRNGDGYFLDFGQGRLGAPLSIRDTVGLGAWSAGTIRNRSNKNYDPREGRYFNPVIGMALSCYGDSCSNALDNKAITVDRFVTDFALTAADFDIPDFPVRKSEFISTGMSEMTIIQRYTFPVAQEGSITYHDTITPNGSGGGVWNDFSGLFSAVADGVALDNAYWELSRGSSNTYGLYFENFGGSTSSVGVGRYSGSLGQEGYTNEMGVRKQRGFRCVVKFDEEIY